MIDSHAHINHPMLACDFNNVVRRAIDAKIRAIINVGYDLQSSKLAVEQAKLKNGFIWASVGIHPHNANTLTDNVLEQLHELALSDAVVAVGEIGLDFYRMISSRDEQLKAFEAQLELACKIKKPVIIHMRNSHEDVLTILKRYSDTLSGILAHCFDSDINMALKFVELGCHIGIAGNVTYKGAEKLREVVRSIPVGKLLTETDSPYLSPIPHRGKRNEPANLVHIVECVAILLSMSPHEVAEITVNNAKSFFRLQQ